MLRLWPQSARGSLLAGDALEVLMFAHGGEGWIGEEHLAIGGAADLDGFLHGGEEGGEVGIVVPGLGEDHLVRRVAGFDLGELQGGGERVYRLAVEDVMRGGEAEEIRSAAEAAIALL